jgi:hypothetical protein
MVQHVQLSLGALQHRLLRGGQVLAAAIDAEVQHRPGRANGLDLRRRLRSAERLSERAMRAGSRCLKIRSSRSSASLVCITCFDQRRPPRRGGLLCLTGHQARAHALELLVTSKPFTTMFELVVRGVGDLFQHHPAFAAVLTVLALFATVYLVLMNVWSVLHLALAAPAPVRSRDVAKHHPPQARASSTRIWMGCPGRSVRRASMPGSASERPPSGAKNLKCCSSITSISAASLIA